MTEMLDQLRRAGQVEVYEIPLIFDMDVFTDLQHFADTSRQWGYDAMVGFGGWEIPIDELPPYTEHQRYVNDPETGAVIDTIETRYYDVDGSSTSGDIMRKNSDGQWVKIGDQDEENDGYRDDSLGQKIKDFFSGKKDDGDGKKNGLIWMPYFLTSTTFFNTPYYEPTMAANMALAQLEELGTLTMIEDYVTQQQLANQPVDTAFIEQQLQSSFAPTQLIHDGVEIHTMAVSVGPS